MDIKQQLAQFIADNLTTKSVDDGKRTIVVVGDNAPQWVSDVCHAAHGDFMPDDWRYGQIQSIAGTLATTDSEDWEDNANSVCDDLIDVYNWNSLQWAASNLNRVEYTNDAVSDIGVPDPFDIIVCLQYGQNAELQEIYNSLVSSIEEAAAGLELFSAGWNVCGYMPDGEPMMFADFEDARQHIETELQSIVDSLADQNDFEAAAEHKKAVEHVGTLGAASSFSVSVGNYEYWVKTRPIADALAD